MLQSAFLLFLVFLLFLIVITVFIEHQFNDLRIEFVAFSRFCVDPVLYVARYGWRLTWPDERIRQEVCIFLQLKMITSSVKIIHEEIGVAKIKIRTYASQNMMTKNGGGHE